MDQIIDTIQTGHSQISDASADWWRGAIIYQIYPRSFQDSNDDGMGDLKGVISRLDYVADLGVDAIWLSPFFPSPQKDFGYDVSNYKDVDPLYGTIDDFKKLVTKAHALGLKVIIDQVISHTSDQHDWFIQSRQDRTNDKADWYIWADPKADGTPPNNWLSLFGGSAWHFDARRQQYYMHNFLVEQPDLNFHNLEVQAAVLDAGKFWLEAGVDGFRLDTVNFFFHDAQLRDNPPYTGADVHEVPKVNPYSFQDHIYSKTQPENVNFLKRVRTLLDQYPATTSVGEVGDGHRSFKTLASYTSDGDKLHMCYVFDFLAKSFGRAHFETVIADMEAELGNGWPCWAFSNHDGARSVSRWQEHGKNPEQFAKFEQALLMCLRGSICLYQGQELGLPEAEIAFEDIQDPYGKTFWPEYKGRDGCRTPMVWNHDEKNGGFSDSGKTWLPVAAEHLSKSADLQSADPSSVLASTKQFIAFRARHSALVKGDLALIRSVHSNDNNCLAFTRSHAGTTIFCLFNMGPGDQNWQLPADWQASDDTKLTPLSGHGFGGKLTGDSIALEGSDAFFAILD